MQIFNFYLTISSSNASQCFHDVLCTYSQLQLLFSLRPILPGKYNLVCKDERYHYNTFRLQSLLSMASTFYTFVATLNAGTLVTGKKIRTCPHYVQMRIVLFSTTMLIRVQIVNLVFPEVVDSRARSLFTRTVSAHSMRHTRLPLIHSIHIM